MNQVKQYTIYLPLKNHTALKVYAAKKDLRISDIINDLIEKFLKGNK